MSEVRDIAQSFAGGEITPELYSRLDLNQFQTGLRTCKNALVLPHGPATCRPGTEYILQTKRTDQVILIPFSFSTEQTYVLEFGHQYLRVHTNGATLLEAAQGLTSITSAYPVGVATYTGVDPANGTWVYLQSVSGMTEVNGRYVVVTNVNPGAKTFELYDLFGDPIDTSGYAAGTGGQMSPVYELSTPYSAADVFNLNYTQNADILTVTHPSYPVYELSRLTASSFSLTAAVFSPSISEPTGVSVVASAGSGTIRYSYVVTAVNEENFEESIVSGEGNVQNSLGATVGNYNTISWTAPATGTAVRYNVYKAADLSGGTNFGVYGFIGQTDILQFQDNNIEPDYSATPPIYEDPFSGVDDYPSAASYFEQRKVFGSTNNRPQNYWMTRSGTERNMSRSLPTIDDDAIFQRLVAREVNKIRHFVPLTELLVLTAGGEWVLDGAGGSAVTPSSISARPQGFEGASHVVPQTTGNSVLYVQASGSRINELRYQWESSGFVPNDVSLLATHLTDDYQITQIAFSKKPDQVLWAVRDDGVLLGVTYVPKHEVNAWHQHDTQGAFRSVAVVNEDNRYVPYFVVQRTINGKTLQYVERLHDRRFAALEDWFGVDAGLTYTGAPATTISGLWHLEGASVDVLADGAVVSGKTVTNGAITLSVAASKAHIGLSYTPEIELLPATFNAEAGGQGRQKSPTRLYLRLHKSKGVLAGERGRVYAVKDRSLEGYGAPTDLISEEIDLLPNMQYTPDGSPYVTRQGPLPLTVTSVTATTDIGG